MPADFARALATVQSEIESGSREMAQLDAWEDRFAELVARESKLEELQGALEIVLDLWPPDSARPFDEIVRQLNCLASTGSSIFEYDRSEENRLLADWQLEALSFWLESHPRDEEPTELLRPVAFRLSLSRDRWHPMLFVSSDLGELLASSGFRRLEQVCERLDFDCQLLAAYYQPTLDWGDSAAFAETAYHASVEVRVRRGELEQVRGKSKERT